ncbi:MAG: DUF3568 family protein [bacterium]|nr:DUF3568 family protein [bacterium]
MKWTLKSKIGLLLVVMVSLSACAAVVVGGAAGATYTYVKGWVVFDYDVGLKKAYRASIKALKHHDLEILENEKDVTIAFVKARGARRDFRVRLKRKHKHVTKVSIRVGVKGDRKASKMIHATIRRFL